ncbi:FtsX-like permease family protein [Ornithinimicrobium murale]|uniref:FtsX-like permease family protein n=1 Tax=Ornithinimicrobium murale TaxID=1050153 RepID=UPI0013B46335|nr:FtsX-like permease family protein [Ornithinimicrobium murale]
MTQALRLGLRLAWSATGTARLRSLAMSLVAFLATVLLLATAALTRAAWARQHADTFYRLRLDDVLTTVLVAVAVALSVGAVVATVSQLSMRLREHRLTNLRLLGMAPGQTRMVAVSEVGAFAVLGWIAGEAVFPLVRPLLGRISLGGQPYAVEHLVPQVLDHLSVALVVPGLVIARGVLRRDRPGRVLVQGGRRGTDRRPGWWRTVPLVVGAGLCLLLISVAEAAREADEALVVGTRTMVLLAVALTLTAVGMLLVVPVFVRLIADLLTRAGGRPTLLVAGRRLQAQPVAMTRVVSALLIGLFLASSALAVVAAYRATPQFERMHRMVTVEQATKISAEPGEVTAVVAAAEAVDGVRRATPVHVARADCVAGEDATCWTTALIGTCADRRAAVPEVTGCRGDRVQEVGYGRWLPPSAPVPAELTLWASGFDFLPAEGSDEEKVIPPGGPSAVVPLPSGALIEAPEWAAGFFGGAVFVPTTLPGVDELLSATPAEIRVVADPGRDLFDGLAAAGLEPGSWEDFSEYDRVIRMGQLVTALSTLFVGLGILSFGLSAVDRAIERRREVISLQLVGAPSRFLRAGQWIEVALPLLLGCTLAIWLGLLVGKAFLGLTVPEQLATVEITQMWPALTAAVVGSLLVGLVTSAAANPRIRPELIRSE